MHSATRSLVPCLHGTKVGEEFGPLDLVAREFRSRRYCCSSTWFGCYVQESGRINSVQSVSEGDEGGALREEHE